jgi:hypothetical protein
MADNPPPARRRSWKDAAAKASGPAKGTDRAWKQGDAVAGPSTRKPWSRTTKRFMALGFLGVLVGGIVWLISIIIPPKPSRVILYGAPNETNLAAPHNLYGWHALQDLEKLTEGTGISAWWSSLWDSGGLKRHNSPTRLTAQEDWTKGWDDVKEGTVIVVLALHGATDKEGRPFLLGEGGRELPMTEVFDAFRRPNLKDKKKVLILDPTQVAAHWTAGMVRNDFVHQLKGLEKEIDNTPGLVVICSSGEDQLSWVSEEWRQSIFLHYVLEGLRGKAHKGSNRINAQQLFDYVEENVRNWAQANREAVQVPILLGNGDGRAAKTDLVLADEKAAASPLKAPGLGFETPGELTEEWKARQTLQDQRPSPAAFAPHLWRKYLDTLARYEQVWRAGDPTKAADVLKSNLKGLRDEMDKANGLNLASLGNSLAMRRAFSSVPPSGQEDSFGNLWKYAASQREETWKELVAKAGGPGGDKEKALRLELEAWLFNHVEKDTPPVTPAAMEDRLKTVREILTLVEQGGERPAEIHLLAMLDKHLTGKKAPPGPVLGAMAARRLAEEAALSARFVTAPDDKPLPAASERVLPWVQGLVEKGDRERRWGEDNLFAWKWDDAATRFNNAESPYNDALNDSEVVRAAFHARDQVMAALPYYARSLLRSARRPAGDRAALETVQGLWRDVHRLDEMLRRQPLASVDELKGQTKKVAEPFRDLTKQFDKDSDRLDKESGDTQERWHKVEDALAVPFMDPKRRERLLNKSRRISEALEERAQGKAAGAPGPESMKGNTEDDGRHQARMALETLGETLFKDLKKDGDHSYGEVQQWIDADKLNEAGAEIGRRWRALPGAVKNQLDPVQRANKESTDSHEDKLKNSTRALTEADRFCRHLDGSQDVDPVNPVLELRRLQLFDLLTWQARRAWLDQWWGEQPNANPYYVVAAKGYFEDAGRAENDLTGNQRKAAIEARSKGLRPGQLPFEWAYAGSKPGARAEVQVMGERVIELGYSLKPDLSLPPDVKEETVGEGFLQLEMKDLPKYRTPEEAKALDQLQEPQPRELRPGKATDGVRVRLLNPRPLVLVANRSAPRGAKEDVAELTMRGFFRGHVEDFKTRINLQATADVIAYQHPVPPVGSVAVLPDSEIEKDFYQPAAVALVLDLSGSMDGPRIRDARKALKEVLKELPKGTWVSLRVFGHQGSKSRTEIRTIRRPEKWKGEEDVDKLMKDADLKPEGFSPIVRAIWEAKEEGFPGTDQGFPKGYKGPKVVVALTDGEDNQFEGDPATNSPPDKELQQRSGVKKISDFMETVFGKSDVMVNIILFQAGATPAEKAETQKKVRKDFKLIEDENRFRKPGVLYDDVDNFDKLRSTLRDALRMRLTYRVLQKDRLRVPFNQKLDPELDVQTSENWFWFPARPSLYQLFVKTDFRRAQDIEVAPGDQVLLTLTPTSFRRALWTDTGKLPERPRNEKEGWRLAALMNKLQPQQQKQEVLAAVECLDRREAPKGLLRQIRPQMVWLELSEKPGEAAPGTLQWGNLAGYPAATWHLEAIPEVSRPSLRAWVNEHGTADSVPLPKGADWQMPVRGRKLPVPGAGEITVTVEVANNTVVDSLGVERSDVPCLMVQVELDKKQQIVALLSDYKPDRDGYEHHYYLKGNTGHYVAVFWFEGLDKKEVAARAKDLSFVALDKFKKAPTTVSLTIPFSDLKEPKSGDIGPGFPNGDLRKYGEEYLNNKTGN